MDCVSNLNVCGAGCCKVVTFDMVKKTRFRRMEMLNIDVGKLSKDYMYYLNLHGMKIDHSSINKKVHVRINKYRFDRETKKLYVYTRCSALMDNNLCRLHDTKDKPLVCTRLDEYTRDKTQFVDIEGCLLNKK